MQPETEIEEKKFRVDDAVAAVKAAMSEGVVAGGGVTLVKFASSLGRDSEKIDGTIFAGMHLLDKAFEQPFRILLENSGVNPDEWLPLVRKGKNGMGIDVNNPTKLIDLKAAGIVDPARVTREAIQNSAWNSWYGHDYGGINSRCSRTKIRRSSSRHVRHDGNVEITIIVGK